MRLIIDNFAKIKHADIVVDGITVIAGKNNTGKSTVGKVLYSTFNSLFDLDERIELQRRREIRDICNFSMRNMLSNNADKYGGNIYSANVRMLNRKMTDELCTWLLESDDAKLDKDSFRHFFIALCEKQKIDLSEDTADETIDATYDKLYKRLKKNNYKVVLEIIQRYFLQVFSSQFQCLKNSEEHAEIKLTIKGKDLALTLKDSQCVEWKSDYNILHEAFFLDDPFILDEINEYFYSMTGTNYIRASLKQSINHTSDIMSNLFDAVSAKENLKEIYDILDSVAAGEISVDNENWGLKTDTYGEPILLENLSAGLKSFVLIKLLLERGILKEKDVLVLDEPEIHLHPEWQLLYAEIVVLLQKKFDLSIVVTTHSRDFLEAIELYSKKYELDSKCNYYLSGIEDGLACFENVSGSLEKIYKQLVSPSMLLDRLRYEIEATEDE